MASIFSYLRTHQDHSFQELPFNDVDRLLFNELSYLPLELLPAEEDGITLEQVGKSLLSDTWAIHRNNPYLVTLSRLRILRYLSESKRYKKITIHQVKFKTTKDQGFPFLSLTLYHPDFQPFIVFRGTDDSMMGWEESLALTYQEDLQSYHLATRYIRQILNHFDTSIEISGHSKGGHSAYMACYYLTVEERQLIKRLTAFDAPGVFDWVMKDKYFQRLTPRIIAYCPNHSLFGRLFYSPVKPTVVEARNASGLVQHILNQWQTFDNHLKLVDEFSLESDFSRELFMRWYNETSVEDKKHLHHLIFQLLKEACIDSFNTLIQHLGSSINQLWLTVQELPHEERSFLLEQSRRFQRLYEEVHEQPKYKGLLKQRYLEWLAPVLSIEKIHALIGLFH